MPEKTPVPAPSLEAEDLKILVILARDALGAMGANMQAQEAVRAWAAVGRVEALLTGYGEQPPKPSG